MRAFCGSCDGGAHKTCDLSVGMDCGVFSGHVDDQIHTLFSLFSQLTKV
jgi:hypothetical protein